MIRPHGLHAAAVFLAVAIGLLSSSCGGKAAPDFRRIDQRKQEIAALSSKIEDWRLEAGLKGLEPPKREILLMHNKPMESAKAVCPDSVRPTTTRCSDVCGLANAICDNAEQICRIADELAGDSWAQGKCSSAKASCKEAKLACCRCRDGKLTN